MNAEVEIIQNPQSIHSPQPPPLINYNSLDQLFTKESKRLVTKLNISHNYQFWAHGGCRAKFSFNAVKDTIMEGLNLKKEISKKKAKMDVLNQQKKRQKRKYRKKQRPEKINEAEISTKAKIQPNPASQPKSKKTQQTDIGKQTTTHYLGQQSKQSKILSETRNFRKSINLSDSAPLIRYDGNMKIILKWPIIIIVLEKGNENDDTISDEEGALLKRANSCSGLGEDINFKDRKVIESKRKVNRIIKSIKSSRGAALEKTKLDYHCQGGKKRFKLYKLVNNYLKKSDYLKFRSAEYFKALDSHLNIIQVRLENSMQRCKL